MVPSDARHETQYRDDRVAIDETGISIQDYYFPSSSPKVIPWARLKAVRCFDVTLWNGKYRVWGLHERGLLS